MAAVGQTKIKLYGTSTPATLPSAVNLDQREIAINLPDKRLYVKDQTNAVVEVGINPSTLTVANTVNMTAGPVNTVKGADIPSASTLNLDNATGDYVNVTGITTIAAITLAAGRSRTVRFTGSLTILHSVAIILPQGLNITTVAGDIAEFRSDGSTVYLENFQSINSGVRPASASGIVMTGPFDAGYSGVVSVVGNVLDLTNARGLTTVSSHLADVDIYNVTMPIGSQRHLRVLAGSYFTRFLGGASDFAISSTINMAFTTRIFTLLKVTAGANGTYIMGDSAGTPPY